MKRTSIIFKILLIISIFYLLTAISIISVVDYKLRIIANENQTRNYIEKLELLLLRLENYHKRVTKTGQQDLYLTDYQNLAISRIKDNYYNDTNQIILPIIIDAELTPLLAINQNLCSILIKNSNNFITPDKSRFGEIYFTYNNTEYWGIYTNFSEWNWHLAYIIPTSYKYSHATELRSNLIFIMTVSTLFSLILLILTLTKIIAPILHLTAVADRIANGNLNQTINVSSNDEIGILAQSLNKMRLAIKEQIGNLHREVIERKQAENNLLVTLNSIGDAVISTDNSGKIIHMNPVAIELTGWQLNEAFGRPLLEVFNIINANTRQQCVSPVEKVLNTGQIVSLENHTILLAKNNKEYHVADSGAPIRNELNEILGVVLVFRDVTEKHQLESQLRQSDKMQAIGQLAGGIAHDFNNMLGGIIGATEILHKYLDKSKQAEELYSIIVNASDRAAELTQQLLAFSRSKKVDSTPVHIHESIIESISLLKRTIDKSVSISSSFKAESDIVIGDPAQLQNIFINLGINASHAMPGGGTLDITTSNILLTAADCSRNNFKLRPGNYIKIMVADTGCGITPEYQSRIFEPFFTTKDEGKGTGLGLSAVYGSILQHHGSIEIESELNRGTVFTILIPVSDITTCKSAHSDIQYSKGKGTILIIDDEELMRATAQAILQDAGYNILLARNGQEGLEVFQQNIDNIDLIILDMIMPVMNGRDCFTKIRKLSPEIKVILASGFSRDEDIANMKNDNLCSFISKPYRSHILTGVIAEMLHTN